MTSVISDHYYQLSADLVVSPAALLLVLDGVHVLNNHAAVLGGHPVIAENINLFNYTVNNSDLSKSSIYVLNESICTCMADNLFSQKSGHPVKQKSNGIAMKIRIKAWQFCV